MIDKKVNHSLVIRNSTVYTVWKCPLYNSFIHCTVTHTKNYLFIYRFIFHKITKMWFTLNKKKYCFYICVLFFYLFLDIRDRVDENHVLWKISCYTDNRLIHNILEFRLLYSKYIYIYWGVFILLYYIFDIYHFYCVNHTYKELSYMHPFGHD